MTIESSLLEQAFVKSEGGTYGTLATPGATDGFRHLELTLNGKHNRAPSQEKTGTPDRVNSLPRGVTADWNLNSAYWEPSGTLGTPSFLGPFLKNGMGAQHVTNLATTIASGAATTGATLTSVTGLQVGDLVVVTLSTGARRELTRIKSIVGSVVTWDPLSAIPDSPGAVVSGVNYTLSSLLPDSLSIFKFHTAGGYKEAVSGAIVDKFGFMFDGSKEVDFNASGPAASWIDTGFSQPGAFTVVGSPASGLVGNVYFDDTAFLVLSAKVDVDNKHQLRRNEIGTNGIATGKISHADFRDIKVQVSFYLEDVSLITKAKNVTRSVLRLLIGSTNGAMVGAIAPSVEFEIPTIPATGSPMVVTIDGVAYGTNGNDALYVTES
jgi:hypothetical protein